MDKPSTDYKEYVNFGDYINALIQNIPSDYILVRVDKKTLVETRAVRMGGLMWLANMIGIKYLQTKDISSDITLSLTIKDKITGVENNIPLPSTSEYVFVAEGYLIPFKYLRVHFKLDDDPAVYTTFSRATGTANLVNTDSKMYPHLHVMAETRAVVRLLRFLTGCSIVAVEELNFEEQMIEGTKTLKTTESFEGLNVTRFTPSKAVDEKAEIKKRINCILSDFTDAKDITSKYLKSIKKISIDELTGNELDALYAKLSSFLAPS